MLYRLQISLWPPSVFCPFKKLGIVMGLLCSLVLYGKVEFHEDAVAFVKEENGWVSSPDSIAEEYKESFAGMYVTEGTVLYADEGTIVEFQKSSDDTKEAAIEHPIKASTVSLKKQVKKTVYKTTKYHENICLKPLPESGQSYHSGFMKREGFCISGSSFQRLLYIKNVFWYSCCLFFYHNNFSSRGSVFIPLWKKRVNDGGIRPPPFPCQNLYCIGFQHRPVLGYMRIISIMILKAPMSLYLPDKRT